MPHIDVCKICKRKKEVSWQSGYCMDCAVAKAKNNNAQLILKKGYYYRHWAAGIKRFVKSL